MKFPVSTKEGGESASLPPTINYIPAPPPPAGPGGIPTPFLNKASHSGAEKTTKNVLVRNKVCLVEGSKIPSSMGDEPGLNQNIPPGKLGLKSRTQTDKAEFTKHSSKVKMEGKGVICLTATTTQNSENTVGIHASPSQQTVLAEM